MGVDYYVRQTHLAEDTKRLLRMLRLDELVAEFNKVPAFNTTRKKFGVDATGGTGGCRAEIESLLGDDIKLFARIEGEIEAQIKDGHPLAQRKFDQFF
jgi:hypothetical protein